MNYKTNVLYIISESRKTFRDNIKRQLLDWKNIAMHETLQGLLSLVFKMIIQMENIQIDIIRKMSK